MIRNCLMDGREDIFWMNREDRDGRMDGCIQGCIYALQ